MHITCPLSGIYNKKYGHWVQTWQGHVHRLCAYRWSAAVRELAYAKYLVITIDEEVILPEHLPDKYICKKRQEDDAACPGQIAPRRTAKSTAKWSSSRKPCPS